MRRCTVELLLLKHRSRMRRNTPPKANLWQDALITTFQPYRLKSPKILNRCLHAGTLLALGRWGGPPGGSGGTEKHGPLPLSCGAVATGGRGAWRPTGAPVLVGWVAGVARVRERPGLVEGAGAS